MTKCELCGEPMAEAESMFKFHGYSGPCPKPPLPKQRCAECKCEILTDPKAPIHVTYTDCIASLQAKLKSEVHSNIVMREARDAAVKRATDVEEGVEKLAAVVMRMRASWIHHRDAPTLAAMLQKIDPTFPDAPMEGMAK